MPLYPYACQDCGAVVEVLHGSDAPGPKRCGHRCESAPDHPARGMGALARQVSAANVVRAASRKDHPTTGDLEKRGFTAYQNLGGGKLKKVGKGDGPDRVG